MPINRNDIINEENITGSSGRTCNHAEIFFDDSRILTIRFDEADVTVLSNGQTFFRQRQNSVTVVLNPPSEEFFLYNRLQNAPTANKRTYEQLARDIMSLYLHTVAQNP